MYRMRSGTDGKPVRPRLSTLTPFRYDKYRGRVPKIDCHGEFDAVLLVLLDKSSMEAIETWRAERDKVIAGLQAPESKARNERSSMGISQFKSIVRRM